MGEDMVDSVWYTNFVMKSLAALKLNTNPQATNDEVDAALDVWYAAKPREFSRVAVGIIADFGTMVLVNGMATDALRADADLAAAGKPWKALPEPPEPATGGTSPAATSSSATPLLIGGVVLAGLVAAYLLSRKN